MEIEPDLVPEWLEPLAVAAFNERGPGLPQAQVHEILVASMRELKGITELQARQETRRLLEAVQHHTGLLAVRGQDADGQPLWAFLHRTFIEYLLARRLSTQWQTGELDLRQYAHRSRWRVVLLLMAGQLALGHRKQVGPLLQALQALGSPHEAALGRDRLLAFSLLADGVPAAPAEMVQQTIRATLELWQRSPIRPLRRRVEGLLGRLRDTEYATIAAREALLLNLTADEQLLLAHRLGPELFADELAVLLHRAELDTQARAAVLLLSIDPEQAGARLLELLPRLAPRLVLEVAGPLAQRAPERVRDRLLELVRQTDGDAALSALEALARLPASVARPALLKLLDHAESAVGSRLEELLAEIDSAEGALLSAARRPGIARWRALGALSRRGDPRWSQLLEDLLNDAEPSERVSAADWLVMADHEPLAPALAVLEQALKETDRALRLDAAVALARFEQEAALEELSRQAEEGEPHERVVAAAYLAEADLEYGIAALIDLTGPDQPSDVRVRAVTELSAVDMKPSLDRLAELVDAPEEHLAFAAATGLLAHDDDRAVPPLLRWLTDPCSSLGQRAAEELEEWRPSNLWPALSKALDSPHHEVRARAATLLSSRSEEEAAEAALPLLDDPDGRVRLAAMLRLSRTGDPRLLDGVRGRLHGLLADCPHKRSPRETQEEPLCVADLAYQMVEQRGLLAVREGEV